MVCANDLLEDIAVEQRVSAFLLVGHEGWVEYVNSSFTAITPYGAEEVHGLPSVAAWR